MKQCTACDGKGIIGTGPNPHLLEGRVSTCPTCGGTGKLTDSGATVSAQEAAAEPAAPTPESPKDNAGSAESSSDSAAGGDNATPPATEGVTLG